MQLLLNKRGEKVVRMHMEDGRLLFVNLKKLTQHKAQLIDTQQSSSCNSVDQSQVEKPSKDGELKTAKSKSKSRKVSPA